MADQIDYKDLTERIFARIKEEPRDYRGYFDIVDCLVKWSRVDVRTPYAYADVVLQVLNRVMAVEVKEKNYQSAELYRQLRYALLKWSAPVIFDHYMQALEYNRAPKERFYYPRREVLLGHVKALQKLADDQLDELFLSQPPRTGKSTLATFFITWIIGRNPELSNLYVSVSDMLTGAFYDGVLEVLNDPETYLWKDIFEHRKVAGTNSKDETLDIDRKKKYHSLTCRSLYSQALNGAADCRGILIADDLLSGIEEAMNPDRLVTAWAHTDNNMLSRAKQGAKILWIGTRWSIADPIGKRIELLHTNQDFKHRRYQIINIPALNENDESNFQYKYNVGFDTQFYRQRRASFEQNNDIASWSAQYQGEPIEREGTLFEPDGMMYYNGDLPEREPDRVFTAIDPAFGGGDYTAAPIVYQYGKEFYVVDVIYDNGEKNITQPLIASKAKKWGIQAIQIEATKATRPYAEGVQTELEKINYHITVLTRSAPTNVGKEQRIFDKASDIRSYFYFLDTAHRTKEYNMFMQNLFSFKIAGKNKHDDAPDSMAMTAEMAFRNFGKTVEIVQRPF